MRPNMGITALLAAWVVTLAACGDSGTSPKGPSGAALSMSYAEGGQYEATGLPKFSGNAVEPGSFAVAIPDSIGGLVLAGFSHTTGTQGDLFILQLADQRTGDFTPCNITSECHGRLLEDIDAANLQDLGTAFEFVDGSVHMDEAGPSRVKGTFSGLVMQSQHGSATRTAESGSFDLPLLSEEEGASIMRCFLATMTGGSCG